MSFLESIKMPNLFGGENENNFEQKDILENVNDNTLKINELMKNNIFINPMATDLMIFIILIAILFIILNIYDFKFRKISDNIFVVIIFMVLLIKAVLIGTQLVYNFYDNHYLNNK
jgi:hypothetical protein